MLIMFSIVNAVYIAYTEGRAAGQRKWMREYMREDEENSYRDYDDGEEEDERRHQALLRRWVEEEEEYDGEDEDESDDLLSF